MKKSGGWKNVPESTQNLIAFSDAFAHVIDSEPISHFIGKVRGDREPGGTDIFLQNYKLMFVS